MKTPRQAGPLRSLRKKSIQRAPKGAFCLSSTYGSLTLPVGRPREKKLERNLPVSYLSSMGGIVYNLWPANVEEKYEELKALGLSFDFGDEDLRNSPMHYNVVDKQHNLVLVNREQREKIQTQLQDIFNVYVADERLNDVVCQVMIILLQIQKERGL